MTRHLSALVLSLFALALVGCARHSGATVSGTVYEVRSAGGELTVLPLSGASVWSEGLERNSGRTDRTGRFEVPMASAGPNTLRVEAVGFPPTRTLPFSGSQQDVYVFSTDLLLSLSDTRVATAVFPGGPLDTAPLDLVGGGLFAARMIDADTGAPLGGARAGVMGARQVAVAYGRGTKVSYPAGGGVVLDRLEGSQTLRVLTTGYPDLEIPAQFTPGIVTTANLALHASAPASPAPSSIAFDEVAHSVGIWMSHTVSGSRLPAIPGVVARDLDGDGDVDLFFTNSARGPHTLYLNDGTGHFSDVSATAGFSQPADARGSCAADVDNDGNPDLYLISADFQSSPSVLYRNLGGGRFQPVPGSPPGPEGIGSSCAFADLDNDGLVDLVVTGSSILIPPMASLTVVYRNLGGGNFEEVDRLVHPGDLAGESVLFIDSNHDGRPDLVVANDFGSPRLWLNQSAAGQISFSESADLKAPRGTWRGIAAGDLDGDGVEDLFIANAVDLRAPFLPHLPQLQANLLGYAQPDGGFLRSEWDRGVADTGFAWSPSIADFDNDGLQDLYVVGNQFDQAYGYVLDRTSDFGTEFGHPVVGGIEGKHTTLLLQQPSGGFVDSGRAAGLDDPLDSRGLAIADFDGNGFLDLVVTNYADPPYVAYSRGNGNHWAAFDLIGTVSNRDAIGAKVTVVAGGKTQVRTVRAGSAYGSQSDLRPWFGLGAASQIDQALIEFPSGRQVTLTNLASNQVIQVKEP